MSLKKRVSLSYGSKHIFKYPLTNMFIFNIWKYLKQYYLLENKRKHWLRPTKKINKINKGVINVYCMHLDEYTLENRDRYIDEVVDREAGTSTQRQASTPKWGWEAFFALSMSVTTKDNSTLSASPKFQTTVFFSPHPIMLQVFSTFIFLGVN